MKRPAEIQINQFQLAVLLGEELLNNYKQALTDYVYCNTCNGHAKKGIEVKEIFLTDLNDILVRGTCKTCNGRVARMLEFGENKEFYAKAMKFRKAIS